MRLGVIVLAAEADYLDGFLARRWGTTSVVGAVLDPVMDKFFMIFVLGVLVAEDMLGVPALLAILSRDIFLIAYVSYLAITGGWRKKEPKAVWWGNVITVLQYLVLVLLTCTVPVPAAVYVIFLAFGLLYLGEVARTSNA